MNKNLIDTDALPGKRPYLGIDNRISSHIVKVPQQK